MHNAFNSTCKSGLLDMDGMKAVNPNWLACKTNIIPSMESQSLTVHVDNGMAYLICYLDLLIK